ncbi:hypothetical protein AB0L67_40790 [Streptomyces flaveolus]|uniref:hypothetical protein n=1 Tax=Streptomyces flaveolus TaxID=67297 RepID=UPI00342DD2CB
MTTSPPETPDPTSSAPARPTTAAGQAVPRERLLDLIALLLFLTITATLYLLIGPSAGMVTGTATGLYTAYRRANTSTQTTPLNDGNQERQ